MHPIRKPYSIIYKSFSWKQPQEKTAWRQQYANQGIRQRFWSESRNKNKWKKSRFSTELHTWFPVSEDEGEVEEEEAGLCIWG